MFGAEPEERWNHEERVNFQAYAAKRIHQLLKIAGWSTGLLLSTVVLMVPYMEGHRLHPYWESVGRYLLLLALGEFLWFVLRWGYVYSAWQSARETRREMAGTD